MWNAAHEMQGPSSHMHAVISCSHTCLMPPPHTTSLNEQLVFACSAQLHNPELESIVRPKAKKPLNRCGHVGKACYQGQSCAAENPGFSSPNVRHACSSSNMPSRIHPLCKMIYHAVSRESGEGNAECIPHLFLNGLLLGTS